MDFLVIEQEFFKLVFLQKLVKYFFPPLYSTCCLDVCYMLFSQTFLYFLFDLFYRFCCGLFTTLGSCKVGLTVLVLLSVCFYSLNQHKCCIFMVCWLGYHNFRNFSCLVFDTWCFDCMYFRLGLCIFFL